MGKNDVIIFDTTLRDGEQSPGCSMNIEEKMMMTEILNELKVDVIEAGFPAASEGDFKAVSEVAKHSEYSKVAGLCRAMESDIDTVVNSIKYAKRGRIHTFISTSPLHMKYKLQKEPEEVIELIKQSVSYSRRFCDDVEWSAEDATRTEADFLCKAVETAINAGATTINIPDTVGYAIPQEYKEIFEMLKNRVPNIDKAILSTHCHDDLGLGVANSIAGIEGGARQVECTINGIGERAGNAALEEVVMAMHVRQDKLPYHTEIITENLWPASQMLSQITGFNPQPNKAVVGENAFAHESGIHQDGILKHSNTYEIMTPESVGQKQTNIVIGKHSGRNAFNKKLISLGFEFDRNDLNSAFIKFKFLADKKKDLTDEDIISVAKEIN